MKIVDSFELTAAKFLMYLFISVHLLYCRYIALNQRILLKKLKNTNFHNREALRKLHMQLEIPSCLEYSPESFNV